MIGGIFRNTTGVAPGYQASLTYKKIALSSSGECGFDTKDRNGSFFYSSRNGQKLITRFSTLSMAF
jgi:hypothetical protein